MTAFKLPPPPEPVWPEPKVAQPGPGELHAGWIRGYNQGVAEARAAWLVSVDDPSTDLPGTVRTSLDGIVVVRREDGGRANPWVSVAAGDGEWFSHESVASWAFTCNVPGTPAWDAAQAVSS